MSETEIIEAEVTGVNEAELVMTPEKTFWTVWYWNGSQWEVDSDYDTRAEAETQVTNYYGSGGACIGKTILPSIRVPKV